MGHELAECLGERRALDPSAIPPVAARSDRGARHLAPSAGGTDPMRVPAAAPLVDEQLAVLTRPFALEEFQDVGILEPIECSIQPDAK